MRAEMTRALKTLSRPVYNPLYSMNGKGRTAKTSVAAGDAAALDWHYSVLNLTTASSSSGDDASSEESPQSHESSESVSQESILGRQRIPLGYKLSV